MAAGEEGQGHDDEELQGLFLEGGHTGQGEGAFEAQPLDGEELGAPGQGHGTRPQDGGQAEQEERLAIVEVVTIDEERGADRAEDERRVEDHRPQCTLRLAPHQQARSAGRKVPAAVPHQQAAVASPHCEAAEAAVGARVERDVPDTV